MIPLTVQEQHLPGSCLEEKFERAVAWGFDGIELRAQATWVSRTVCPSFGAHGRTEWSCPPYAWTCFTSSETLTRPSVGTPWFNFDPS